jgi:SNF2 family DNA or RNA helicase
LFDELDDVDILKELTEKRNNLLNVISIKNVRKPRKLTATLRDYQKEGLNWLNFLKEIGWGGILADDMGLGKTIQILAALLNNPSKKPDLIVVPTSLLFNWQNEIEKFCPSLEAKIHYGPKRTKNCKDLSGSELIITTYGALTNDISWLREIKFNHVVLDESQAIKNPTSLRYKAVCLLKGNHKIAMTGTPIENNTFDLFAQMNFVNPGYLGTAKSFKDNYSTPIDVNKNGEVAKELQKLVNPFLLRRTKEKVATELPAKIEDIIYCEMEQEQRAVYDAFKNKIKNDITSKIEADGLGKSKMKILEGLLKLRQICDSPEILNTPEDYGTDSVKIKELIRHIKEKTANHKILIFSQFVKMLGLIKDQLEKEGITYEYLDGSCNQKRRQESVENFQGNKDCRVFLISLKAGGTGLNLTEADYVYIVDPWWNPAVENQAIDRCYRIGQKKKVIAYRMICKNTIEEKIVRLQQNKKQLATDLISADENILKSLSGSDIKELFE